MVAHREQPEPATFLGSVFYTIYWMMHSVFVSIWLLGTIIRTAIKRRFLNYTCLCGAVFSLLSLWLLFHWGLRVILVFWDLCTCVTHSGRSLNFWTLPFSFDHTKNFLTLPFSFGHTNWSKRKNLVTWVPITFASAIYKKRSIATYRNIFFAFVRDPVKHLFNK